MSAENLNVSSSTKLCKKCKEQKPATLEFFYINRNVLSSPCIACIQRSRREYLAAHREQRNAYCRAWHQRNREKSLADNKAWRLAHLEQHRENARRWRNANLERAQANEKSRRIRNPDGIKASARKRYYKHRDSIREQAHKYYAENSEKVRATVKAWRQANPEKVLAMNAKRRARKANAPINDFTAEQWLAMQAHYDHRCVYCGKRRKGHLTQDHLTPIIKGGSHTQSNIVPACQSCNSKKHTSPPRVPVQPLLL